MEAYEAGDVYSCYPYLSGSVSDPAPPAVFAAAVHAGDSVQVRDAKNQMLLDILEEAEQEAAEAISAGMDSGEARAQAGAGLWAPRGPGTKEPECTAFEELMRWPGAAADPDIMARVMDLAPTPVPRSCCPLLEQIADTPNDTRSRYPLMLAALVVYCVSSGAPFAQMHSCLLSCLECTPAADLAGSLVTTRVAARQFTLLSFCCYQRQPEYALFVLLNAVPPAKRAAYARLLDEATNSAQHYAELMGQELVLAALHQLAAAAAAATPSLPREPELQRRKRTLHHEDWFLNPTKHRALTADLDGEASGTIIPGDPEEVRIRLVYGVAKKEEEEEEEEVVAVSRATFIQMVKSAAEWVECEYLFTSSSSSSSRNKMLLDSAAMRKSAADRTRYITLQSLGFTKQRGGLVDRADLLGVPLLPLHRRITEVTDVLLEIAEEDAMVDAVPWEDFAHAVPKGPLRVLHGSMGAMPDAFVSFSPEEQRALVQYHHQWNDPINGMLRAASAEAYFAGPTFDPLWQTLGPTKRAAEENVRAAQQRIDGAFRHAMPLTEEIVVYRGIRYDSDLHGDPVPEKTSKVGLQKAFLSTSVSDDAAREFVDAFPCCIQVIRVPRGMPVIYMEPLAVEHAGEDEVLLPRLVELVPDNAAKKAHRPTPRDPIKRLFFTAVLTSAGQEVLEPLMAAANIGTTPQRRMARSNDYGSVLRCTTFKLAKLK